MAPTNPSLLRRIKRFFDPQGVLSPGVLIDL